MANPSGRGPEEEAGSVLRFSRGSRGSRERGPTDAWATVAQGSPDLGTRCAHGSRGLLFRASLHDVERRPLTSGHPDPATVLIEDPSALGAEVRVPLHEGPLAFRPVSGVADTPVRPIASAPAAPPTAGRTRAHVRKATHELAPWCRRNRGSGPAALRGARAARLPTLWDSRPWLRSLSLFPLRLRRLGGLLLQGTRILPVMRWATHGGVGSAPRGPRHP